MKKAFLVASLATLMMIGSKNASAQYYFFDDTYYDNPVLYEAGISVNAMNCLTDLGGHKGIGKKFIKDLNTGYTHLSGGVFFSVAFKNEFVLRLEGTFGQVSAHDEVLAGVTDIAAERYNRNLNFRSYISEVAAIAEIHPLYIFVDWPARDQQPPRTSPYLLAGIGYYSFNPQAKSGSRFVDLQPLSTEGEGFPEYPDRPVYKLNQVNVPLGFGVKYELGPLVNIRGEFVYRKLFTDYLDDLSTTYIDPALFYKYFSPDKASQAASLADQQISKHAGVDGKRGTATNNDAYFSFNLKLSLVIGRERMRK